MNTKLTRRDVLRAGGVAAGSQLLMSPASTVTGAAPTPPATRCRYCLNTSTIRGQKLDLPALVDIAADAGYDAIEPWVDEIQRYAKGGGNLPEMKQRIADRGLTVESAIGFARWMVDDPQQRAQGLQAMRRDMDLVRQIGGKRIAAPPAGANRQEGLDLFQAAERYRVLLELGEEMGVTPQLEIWGPSKSMHRLGELLLVAIESNHPSACLLPDVYHIYRGGSDLEAFHLISGRAIHVFHLNDYPGDVPRDQLNDADRVYPGDGVAPLPQLLRTLWQNGFDGVLSLELFNRDLWKQDPSVVARTGLKKLQTVVAASFAL